MNYSREEMVDMIFILGECSRNSLLASRVYETTYPERRHPLEPAFSNLKDRFIETGKVQYKPHEVPARKMTEENEYRVMISLVEHPTTSTRELSNNLDISGTIVRRIVQKNKFHPYKIQLHQELLEDDFLNRVNFCEWSSFMLDNDPDFIRCLMFSDEATFHKNGCVNRHNFHYYSDVNPHLLRTVSQQRWSLNVWGAVVGPIVIGPHFFNGRLNGRIYHDFLENELPVLLENVPLDIRQKIWFQQDGAPPHFSANVREWLDRNFNDMWIGRGAAIAWPARSPDLTGMDFFLWGYVKDIVYRDTPTTVDDMKNRIRRAFASITQQMLQEMRHSFRKRIQMCLDRNGEHFEHLLK